MATVLKQGSSGPEVRQVQQSLNKAGRTALPKLVEDGVFGPKTRARVVEFQKSRALFADGIVGPQTRAALGSAGGIPGAGQGVVGDTTSPGDIDAGSVAGTVVRGTTYALSMWTMQASFQGIRIMSSTAIGTPGCLTGPALGGLILGSPMIFRLRGDDLLIAQAAAQGIGAEFAAWQRGVSVPGLLWYPLFAAFPGPMAPPMPNVPTPLAALPSVGTARMISPASLQGAMEANLDPGVRARDTSGKAGQAFAAIAGRVAGGFLAWMSGRRVINVLGTGPVPTYAPPVVLVGPVVGGFTLPGGPHLG